MPNQYRSGDNFRDISAIDARLTELDQEKQPLIAIREELQKSNPTWVAGFVWNQWQAWSGIRI